MARLRAISPSRMRSISVDRTTSGAGKVCGDSQPRAAVICHRIKTAAGSNSGSAKRFTAAGGRRANFHAFTSSLAGRITSDLTFTVQARLLLVARLGGCALGVATGPEVLQLELLQCGVDVFRLGPGVQVDVVADELLFLVEG